MLLSRHLLTGTASTGRAQPQWIGRIWVDEFFFKNHTLPVSYPCPSRVHGYHGHGYGYGYEYRSGLAESKEGEIC
jgi:hypothetical protein